MRNSDYTHKRNKNLEKRIVSLIVNPQLTEFGDRKSRRSECLSRRSKASESTSGDVNKVLKVPTANLSDLRRMLSVWISEVRQFTE